MACSTCPATHKGSCHCKAISRLLHSSAQKMGRDGPYHKCLDTRGVPKGGL